MRPPVSRNRVAPVNTAWPWAGAHPEADTLVGSAPCPAPPDDRLPKDTP